VNCKRFSSLMFPNVKTIALRQVAGGEMALIGIDIAPRGRARSTRLHRYRWRRGSVGRSLPSSRGHYQPSATAACRWWAEQSCWPHHSNDICRTTRSCDGRGRSIIVNKMAADRGAARIDLLPPTVNSCREGMRWT
jgi:hypothetical protein